MSRRALLASLLLLATPVAADEEGLRGGRGEDTGSAGRRRLRRIGERRSVRNGREQRCGEHGDESLHTINHAGSKLTV